MKLLTAGSLAIALLLVSWTGAEVAEVGTAPKHTFTSPVVNGMGVKDLAELRGRPVLVEFWGTY